MKTKKEKKNAHRLDEERGLSLFVEAKKPKKKKDKRYIAFSYFMRFIFIKSTRKKHIVYVYAYAPVRIPIGVLLHVYNTYVRYMYEHTFRGCMRVRAHIHTHTHYTHTRHVT